MAKKKEVKEAMIEKPMSTIKIATQSVKPALPDQKYEKPKQSKRTVKKALPK